MNIWPYKFLKSLQVLIRDRLESKWLLPSGENESYCALTLPWHSMEMFYPRIYFILNDTEQLGAGFKDNRICSSNFSFSPSLSSKFLKVLTSSYTFLHRFLKLHSMFNYCKVIFNMCLWNVLRSCFSTHIRTYKVTCWCYSAPQKEAKQAGFVNARNRIKILEWKLEHRFGYYISK